MSARGALEPTEPHPAIGSAQRWLGSLRVEELLRWQEVFASTAIEGNRLAEVCGETLRRLLDQEPVSDRYLLGLVWVMRLEEVTLDTALAPEVLEAQASLGRAIRAGTGFSHRVRLPDGSIYLTSGAPAGDVGDS